MSSKIPWQLCFENLKRARFFMHCQSSKIWASREKLLIVTRNWLIIENLPLTKTNTRGWMWQRLMRATMISSTIFQGFQFHLEWFSRINVSKIVGDDPCAPWNSIGTFVDGLLLTDAGLLGYTHTVASSQKVFESQFVVCWIGESIWYLVLIYIYISVTYKWNTFGEIGVSNYTKTKERLRFESGFLKVNQWSLFRCLLFWHFSDSTWLEKHIDTDISFFEGFHVCQVMFDPRKVVYNMISRNGLVRGLVCLGVKTILETTTNSLATVPKA